MATTKPLRLPVVSTPGLEEKVWAEDPAKRSKPLLPIADSLVLLQSLRQSRNVWLNSALTKFTALPSRPGPLTNTFLGTSDIEIGPHIFPETKFFEVTYPTPPLASPIQASGQQSAGYYPYSAYQSPYGYSQYSSHPYYAQFQHQPSQSATSTYPSGPQVSPSSTSRPPIASSSTSTPAPSSLGPTPQLISQIDVMAGKDPELKRLLGVAAEGTASQAELESLAQRIKVIQASSTSTPTTNPSTPKAPAVPLQPAYPPATETDILIEFAETPNERFILPLANSIVERVFNEQENVDPSTGRKMRSCDIIISTVMPPNSIHNAATKTGKPDCHPVTIKLIDASSALWLAVSKKVQYKNEARLQKIAKVLQDMLRFVPSRVYLQHRLPEGTTNNNIKVAMGLKRKDPSDSAEALAKKSKPPTTFRPSGLHLEVVMPPRPSASSSRSTSQASISMPSERISSKPNPNLKMEVVIPRRQLSSKPPATLPTTPRAGSSNAPPTPGPMPSTPQQQVPGANPYAQTGYPQTPYSYWPPATYRNATPNAWAYPWTPNTAYYSYMQYNANASPYGQTQYPAYNPPTAPTRVVPPAQTSSSGSPSRPKPKPRTSTSSAASSSIVRPRASASGSSGVVPVKVAPTLKPLEPSPPPPEPDKTK